MTAGLAARAAAVLAARLGGGGRGRRRGGGLRAAAEHRTAACSTAPAASAARSSAAAELRRAAAGEEVLVEREVPGIEGTARVLARRRRRLAVVVVGQSLDDRDETLGNLVASFADRRPDRRRRSRRCSATRSRAAGLRPVEAMRRRAQDVSLSRGDERLPLPAAHDEIRRLGETLNEMLDRLRRSFERERRFVADASHELRTPVAVIKAELEGALRAGGHDPQVREALVAALEECDHLAQLAEDLLVVARTSEGELPVRPERLELRELLERVARALRRPRRRARPHDLGRRRRRAGRATPTSCGCARRSATSSTTRCATAGRDRAARRVAHGAACELEVSDQGDGFAPDFAERAFERFARGDLARTRDGTGLGLSIVRAIAEAHGGRAEIVPGAGATVRLWLPDGPWNRLRVISDCRRSVSALEYRTRHEETRHA